MSEKCPEIARMEAVQAIRNELNAAADEAQRRGVMLEKAWAQLAGLDKENTRLRAIVDKLPKTADGVPVIPMINTVYVHRYFEPTEEIVECDINKTWGVPVHRIGESYSTREAAEAAAKANKDA